MVAAKRESCGTYRGRRREFSFNISGGIHNPMSLLWVTAIRTGMETRTPGDLLATGFLFLLDSGLVSWNSNLQPRVALSSAEAEYMAACAAVQERQSISARHLLEDLGFKHRSSYGL
jgi:hypothetical protein